MPASCRSFPTGPSRFCRSSRSWRSRRWSAGSSRGPRRSSSSARGPRVLQPYYDICKLLRKETVLPAPAGPVFRAAPYVSFAALRDGAAADPGADHLPAAARVHGGLPRRGLDPRAGELRGLDRGDRQRQPLRPARLEPAAVVRRVQRADRDLRDVRAGADHAHRPAVRVRRDAALGDGAGRAARAIC